MKVNTTGLQKVQKCVKHLNFRGKSTLLQGLSFSYQILIPSGKQGREGWEAFVLSSLLFPHLGLHFILLHTDTQSFLRHMTPDQGTDLTHTSNISVMPLYHKGRD